MQKHPKFRRLDSSIGGTNPYTRVFEIVNDNPKPKTPKLSTLNPTLNPKQ
jgi:hypothetical protein